MGCGSSSLKGDAPGGLTGDDAPAPIRKVNTNFSTINYDQNDNKKRRMTEYAPHETIRNRSEASGVDPNRPPPDRSNTGGSSSKPPGTDDADNLGPNGDKLEPYHTVGEGPDGIPLKDRSYPHEKATTTNGDLNGEEGPDPTSGKAKDEFASANDPINHQQAGSGSLSPDDGMSADKKKRGSWIDRLRGGEQREITDEEMKKYTGKTKAEMSEYVKTGPGVGARQGARNYAVGGDGGADGGGASG